MIHPDVNLEVTELIIKKHYRSIQTCSKEEQQRVSNCRHGQEEEKLNQSKRDFCCVRKRRKFRNHGNCYEEREAYAIGNHSGYEYCICTRETLCFPHRILHSITPLCICKTSTTFPSHARSCSWTRHQKRLTVFRTFNFNMSFFFHSIKLTTVRSKVHGS